MIGRRKCILLTERFGNLERFYVFSNNSNLENIIRATCDVQGALQNLIVKKIALCFINTFNIIYILKNYSLDWSYCLYRITIA